MSYWNDNVDIDIDVEEIINDIPTSTLEEELEKRKQQLEDNPETFKAKECFRYNTVTFPIDPHDYDLIKSDEAQLSDFPNSEIVSYLIRQGFTILCGEHFFNKDELVNYLQEMRKDMFKDVICDCLNISRFSSNEEIIKKIKTKL